MTYQILNPGMRLWFSRERDAVAGYVSFAGVRVVAGAPIAADDRLHDAARELEADADAAGERVVYFGAGTRLEQILMSRSEHRRITVGAQPVWNPQEWSAVVRRRASLRAQLNRARNKGVCIEEWSAGRAHHAPALRAVLHEWLAARGLPPLGFLVTPDLFGTLEDRRIFVATRGSCVIAFLIATPVPARAGWLVEQWPRVREAPNGTTHLLVDAAMRAFAASGSTYATLGLAPLASHAVRTDAEPLWIRALFHWLSAHGRRFYNFRGLEAFKAGMDPLYWEPLFAIARGERMSPGMLRAIAGAFSGGSPERLLLRALASAGREELRWLGRRNAPRRGLAH